MCEYSGIYKLVAIKHNVANMIYMVNLCKPFFIVVAIVFKSVFDSPNLKSTHLILRRRKKLLSFHVWQYVFN